MDILVIFHSNPFKKVNYLSRADLGRNIRRHFFIEIENYRNSKLSVLVYKY